MVAHIEQQQSSLCRVSYSRARQDWCPHFAHHILRQPAASLSTFSNKEASPAVLPQQGSQACMKSFVGQHIEQQSMHGQQQPMPGSPTAGDMPAGAQTLHSCSSMLQQHACQFAAPVKLPHLCQPSPSLAATKQPCKAGMSQLSKAEKAMSGHETLHTSCPGPQQHACQA